MFCEKCGKEVQDESVVCLGCGCSLESSPETNIDNQDLKKDYEELI